MECRGCVIHPTGTGKSFIGFRYCEDHLQQTVLWLSPSEYIFITQCESLRAAGDVASQMTLGEAIVRGILNPPRYVLSIFSYQNDLEKYQRRIRNVKIKNLLC